MNGSISLNLGSSQPLHKIPDHCYKCRDSKTIFKNIFNFGKYTAYSSLNIKKEDFLFYRKEGYGNINNYAKAQFCKVPDFLLNYYKRLNSNF